MIVVTDTGQVENCIYPKPSGASMDDLNIIAQKLTKLFDRYGHGPHR